MNNPEISIIIPIYNVDPYLYRCLSSVANQTFKNYEVIMVDDGSTDESMAIAKSFETTYSNFIFLQNDKKGVASARNKAILRSCGKYLAFVDSDDYVDPNYLRHLHYVAEKEHADVTCCNYATYNQKKGTHHTILLRHPRNGVHPPEKIAKMVLRDISMRSYLWNKLWRRELFFDHDILLPEMYFEDLATVFRLIFFANRVAVTNVCLYYYRKRSNSIVSTFDFKIMNGYMQALGVIRNFLEKEKSFKKYRFSFSIFGTVISWVNLTNSFMLHIKNRSLTGLGYNLSATMKCMRTYMSKKFEPYDDVIVPLPAELISPIYLENKKNGK